MIKTLECSSRGDKRFSAFYAKVEINGVFDTIEHHYQNCKYNTHNQKCHKGEHVAYIIINNKRYEASMLTPFYRLLWFKYLKEHKDLVEYASQFNEFTDMFRGHSINCQADCIKAFVNRDNDFYKCIFDFRKNKYIKIQVN